MKKVLSFVFVLFLIPGCATMQPRQTPTVLMNSDAKIQYYQEQITRYQHLIDLEKAKAEKTSKK
jgi:hypothetical protein